MPWRLIKFIAIFAIFLLFIVFNLDNRSDISIGFRTFRDVPVFLTSFFAFIAGLLLAIPFMVNQWLRARKGESPAKKPGKKGGKKGVTDKQGGASEPNAGHEGLPIAEFKDYGID